MLLLWLLAATPKLEIVPQIGHGHGASAMAFSPDGARLVSVSAFDLKIWSMTTGRLERTIKVDAMIGKVVVHPDGTTALVTGQMAMLYVDLATGAVKQRVAFPRRNSNPSALQLSRDGKLAAVALHSGEVYLIDVEHGQVLHTLSIPTAAPHAMPLVALSPDGSSVLVSRNNEPVVVVFDARTGAQLKKLDTVKVTQLATDGRTITVAGYADFKPTLDVLDFDGKRLVSKQAEIHKLAAIEDLIFAGAGDGSELRSGADGRVLATFDRPHALIFAVDRDRKHFALSTPEDPKKPGSHNLLQVRELPSGRLLWTLGGAAASPNFSSFTDDGNILSSAGREADLWDVNTGKTIRHFAVSEKGINFTLDRDRLVENVMIGTKASSRFIDSKTGAILFELGDSATLGILAPHQSLIGVLRPDYTKNEFFMRVIDVRTGQQLVEFSGFPGSPAGTAFSPDETLFAAAAYSKDFAVRVWDLKQPTKPPLLLSGHTGPVHRIVFSADATRLLTTSGDGTARTWDAATGREIAVFRGHEGDIYAGVFLPDSGDVVTGGKEGKVCRWSAATGQLVQQLGTHNDTVYLVTLMPDKRSVLTGSGSETKIWSAHTGKLERTFAGTTASLDRFLSPDGKLFLTLGGAGLQIWNYRTGTLIATRAQGHDGEWLASTESGQFDLSSERARDLVAWRVGDEVLGADQFFEVAYTPGLMQVAMQGKTKELTQMEVPPDVRLIVPKNAVANVETEITVEVGDRGGGVGEVRLYHSGRLIGSTTQRGVKKTSQKRAPTAWESYKFTTILLAGDNALRASAFSSSGVESEPAEQTLQVAGAKATAALWALTVGINDYEVSDFKLKVSRGDAEALATALEQRGKSLFTQVTVKRLLDREATRAGIVAGIEWLAQNAKPQDVVVLFLSGHGDTDPDSGRYSFLPADFRFKNMASLEAAGLSQQALSKGIAGIKARKLLVLLDTCKSGQAAKSLGAMLALRGVAEQRALAVLARASGVAVAAASTDKQSALEDTGLGHGVFTHVLLEAIAAPREVMTVSRLLSAIETQVPKLTEQKYGRLQDPIVMRTGQDFPLVAP